MVFEHAIKTYTKNTGLLLVFSVSFLLGLLMPILASTPTFSAIGAVFLRFMSIPQMTVMDFLVIGIAFVLSNYFVAFGLVAVNLIVKRERVQINLTTEIINNIARNTLIIFLIFTSLFLVNYAAQMLLMELQAPYWLAGIIFFLIYIPTFYVGPAIVIDEMKPFHAVMASISHIRRYPIGVVKWVALGLSLLLVTSAASYLLLPAYFQWITLVVNSFFIIPFLLVYQAHIYIEKYGILKEGRKGSKVAAGKRPGQMRK